MNRVSIFTFIFLAGCSAHQDDLRPNVPRSPISEVEMEKKGYSDDKKNKNMGSKETLFTYRDKDIRAAFPQLGSEYYRLDTCMNSMMAGSTLFTYAAEGDVSNELLLKTLRCRSLEEGLHCKKVSEKVAFFVTEPKKHFTISANLTFFQAKEIIEIYKSGKIFGLPEWWDWKAEDVSAISFNEFVYRLNFGRDIVCGCTGIIYLFPENDELGSETLRVIGNPESMCV